MAEDSFTTQVISRDGIFNAAAIQQFSNSVNLKVHGLAYAVVAVIGPQSSGKSTLVNHLFGTNFREMNTFGLRTQTTKGIWIGKGVGIEPLTLVLDLEGSDSRERGEDDQVFEKQSALFALAVADIILINMWFNDIGREAASSKPLLRIVFQAMTRMLRPNKTTLLYVIRDKSKAPLENLETTLREDIQMIWDAIPKHRNYKDKTLSEVFNVEVIGLSSLHDKEEEFKEQVTKLRERFQGSRTSGGLACDRLCLIPAKTFCSSAQQIWETIKQNKDLDLPSHAIMIATVRCQEIAHEKLNRLASNQDWDVDSGAVSGFGERTSTILNKYLSEYDVESEFYVEEVRYAKRQHLLSEAMKLVYPCYKKGLTGLRWSSFGSFKIELEEHLRRGEGFAASVRWCQQSCLLEFDVGALDVAIEQADWNASSVRRKLECDIEAHASRVRSEKLSQLVDKHQNEVCDGLTQAMKPLFKVVQPDLWASIRGVLTNESATAGSSFSSAIVGFELDQEAFQQKVNGLKEYGQSLVVKIVKEKAKKIVDLMKQRFGYSLFFDQTSWNEDRITKDVDSARYKCLLLLSEMAVIRLGEEIDNVKHVLFWALWDNVTVSKRDVLASNTWDQVPPERTLITPIECRSIWKRFIQETDEVILIARANPEAAEEANHDPRKKRSFWAIVGMLCGFIGRYLQLQLKGSPYVLPLLVAEFLFDKFEEDIPVWYKKGKDFFLRQKYKLFGFMEELKKRLIEFAKRLKEFIATTFGSEKAYKYTALLHLE